MTEWSSSLRPAKPAADGLRLGPAAARRLEAHDWPGNVRELANAMERAALLARSEVILPEHLPPALRKVPEAEDAAETATSSLEAQEVSQIRRVLEQTGGNRTRAAEILGISRRGLIYNIKRFGL